MWGNELDRGGELAAHAFGIYSLLLPRMDHVKPVQSLLLKRILIPPELFARSCFYSTLVLHFGTSKG